MTHTSVRILFLSASTLALSSCAHHAAGPMLLEDKPEAAAGTWIAVGLTVSGPEADGNKRDDCIEEAHTAHIQLSQAAPIKGVLSFKSSDDTLESTVLPNGIYTLASMKANSECRVALAKLVSLDDVVKTSKSDPPAGCKNLGSVDGSDTGFLRPGSYDAAMAEAQFRAHSLGANYMVIDAADAGGTAAIHGRAFACPK